MEEDRKTPEEVRTMTRLWFGLGMSMIAQMEARESVVAEVAKNEYEKEFGSGSHS